MANGRDRFLDLLRTVSILRVVVVHLLGPLGVGRWYNWVFPGMPVVFFVSGALALASLDPLRERAARAWPFVRSRFTRLLVPYWCFAGVLFVCGTIAALVHRSPYTALRPLPLVTLVLPGVVPTWSPAVRAFTGHLWFLSNFLVLLAAAPLLVRAYRRWWGWPLVISLGYYTAAQVADYRGIHLPRELRSLSLYAVMFCAGFSYFDGGRPVPRRLLYVLWLAAVPVAVWATATQWGTPNRNPVIGLPVAVCWLGAALAARGPLTAFAGRWGRHVDFFSSRAMTMYLWGWPTSRLALRTSDALFTPHGGAWTACFVAVAVAGLAVATAVFSPVERWAARRAREVARPVPSG